MNRSMPGLPVHHQLPEFTQTHVHRVSDAIQPSHPVVPFSSCLQSLPASEAFPMSQLLAWGGQRLEFQLQHHSFQRNPRADLLQNGLVGSPCRHVYYLIYLSSYLKELFTIILFCILLFYLIVYNVLYVLKFSFEIRRDSETEGNMRHMMTLAKPPWKE